MTTVNKPCCIDIYKGDEVQDLPARPLYGLDRVKEDGIFALIHKATEGTQYRDARYDARREKWMTGNPVPVVDTDGQTKLLLSPLWAAYAFFHGGDPKGEAGNFLMTARLKAGDMAFVDWEAVGASGFQPSIEATDTFCQIVEQATGRVCGVYGGNVPRERFAAERASDAVLERFESRPFWFCAYNGGAKLFQELPEPWKKAGPFLWQDDGDKFGPGPHTVPGMIGYCDNSTVVAPMTFAKLHALWLGEVIAPPKAAAPPAPPPPPVAQADTKASTAGGTETLGDHIKEEVAAFEKHIADEITELTEKGGQST